MIQHALVRRFDEILERGTYTSGVLVMRLNRILLEAGVKESLDTSADLPKLSETAAKVAYEHLSHGRYGHTPDVDLANTLAARKAS
jgi:hypothetical protein